MNPSTAMLTRNVRALLVASTLLLAPATASLAAEPEGMVTYSGDGISVVVSEWNEETGNITGTIKRGADAWPFTGKHSEEANGAEIVCGTFTVGAEKYPFTTRQDPDSEVVVFTTGDKTYRLKAGAVDPGKPAPVPQPVTPPVPSGVATPNAPAAPAAQAGQMPSVMKLRLHQFPDVTMGVPNAYQVLLPEGWTSEGKIEWTPGDLTYPQPSITITSPDQGRAHLVPAITLMYTEMKPLQGFDPMPPSGVPAPTDLPQWYIEAVKKSPKYSNVQFISSRRDQKAEEASAAGQQGTGMTFEAHVVTLEWDEAGIRRRGETSMLYVKHAPYENQNIRSETWSVFTSSIINGPKDKFESQKQQLQQIARTIIATPQWWTLSQKLLADFSRIRAENRWDEIKRRGAMINQMSDDDWKTYKANNRSSNAAQHDRINAIYETGDYKDTNGAIVNLPMYYKNVYSDGKGNYVLSNNTQDKPGELWNALEPMK